MTLIELSLEKQWYGISLYYISALHKLLWHYIAPEHKFFRAVLCSQNNRVEDTEIPHAIPCPHICRASPIINIPHQGGIFVITDELH